MTIFLDRTTSLQDGHGRPLYPGSTGLTVERAAAAINRQTDLPGYVEVRWRTFEHPDVPSVDAQVQTKLRRLRTLADKIGRVVVMRSLHRDGCNWSVSLAR